MAAQRLQYSYDTSGNLVSRALENIFPPQINGQPVKQIAAPSDIVTFSVVVADAHAVTFQWKFNGTDIPGATSDSLVLTNVGDADEGQYSVVVTNSAGSVTSAPAALILDGTNPDTSLRLTAYSDVGGSVTVVPMKLSYDLGDTITLTATPFPPGVFIGWTGDLNGASNPATLSMDKNKQVRGRFASAVPPPPGLVAWWRGETGASDLIGDHHGTFFTGTNATAPTLTAEGKVGSAFTFDGTVYIQVPDAIELHPSELTVEAWVFPTAHNETYQTIAARGSRTDAAWWFGLFTGRPQFWSNHFRAVAVQKLAVSPQIPLNQWSHLAMTFDGLTKRLYINGAQVETQSEEGALLYGTAPVPVTIGASWAANAPADLFQGQIDEISLYNRALSLDEVREIYNADVTGKNATQPYFTSLSPLPDVALGANYTQQLTTSLGTAPISFSLSTGMLPPGMTLSQAGAVSGAPGAPGVFDFTVRATDAVGLFSEQLFVLRASQSVVPPSDLVAWWRGEPAPGSDVLDSIGGHHGGFFSGNASAAPTYAPDGKVGSALTFDGTVYVRVPDAVELRPPELTIEAWVFPTELSGTRQTIIARGSPANNAWWLGTFYGRPQFWSFHLDLGILELEAPEVLPPNQWAHLAMSFGTTKTKRLYVNGAQVASKGGLSTLVYGGAPVPVTIGAAWAVNAPISYLFRGRIDEVSLYSRALSSAEIMSIYNAGPAGKRLLVV